MRVKRRMRGVAEPSKLRTGPCDEHGVINLTARGILSSLTCHLCLRNKMKKCDGTATENVSIVD